MKFNNWFKYIWWGLLIIACLLLLKNRYKIIQTGALCTFDSALLIVFIVLTLIPFFSEMSFLGFSIKKDITELKKEVKDEVKEIKAQILAVTDINNRFNPQIYFGQAPAPPPDDQLNKLEERFKRIIRNTLVEKGIDRMSIDSGNFNVPEDNKLLFSARYQIERELTRIWNNRFINDETKNRRHYPIYRLVEDLVKSEILPPNLGGIIKEVYAVCSPAIHGEEPSKKQVEFINDVIPELMASLKEIG